LVNLVRELTVGDAKQDKFGMGSLVEVDQGVRQAFHVLQQHDGDGLGIVQGQTELTGVVDHLLDELFKSSFDVSSSKQNTAQWTGGFPLA